MQHGCSRNVESAQCGCTDTNKDGEDGSAAAWRRPEQGEAQVEAEVRFLARGHRPADYGVTVQNQGYGAACCSCPPLDHLHPVPLSDRYTWTEDANH